MEKMSVNSRGVCQQEKSKNMQTVLNHQVIPVLSVDDVELGLGAVSALEAGGITCVEVTLRSPNALDVLAAICQEFPGMQVGAGSVRSASDFIKVIDAGATFAVSPGCTSELMEESKRWDIPYLPAAATVSEILVLLQAGFTVVKVFPAGALGGVSYLKNIAGPLPGVQFVPSGSITMDNFLEYLTLEAVPAVSGSWMLPGELIASKRWDEIRQLSEQTVKRLG